MITRADLDRWHSAKTLAVLSCNIEPDIAIAMQEMFIEIKQLRKDNLKFLNMEELLGAMAEYIRVSREDHYMTETLTELLERIEDIVDASNLNLELEN